MGEIIIKTPDEIEKMRQAGRLASNVLEMIDSHVESGVTTEQLDNICHEFIVNEQKAIPAPLNYKGFPKSICTSVNNEICHGIPDSRVLKNGDIVNIDITVIKDGFHGDTSKMFCVGKVAPFAQRLIDITQQCLYESIKIVKAGANFRDIGHRIQGIAERNNYSVVREFCGHGIGRGFHEAPQVLHYGNKEIDEIMKAGMIFTIEPMINMGTWRSRILANNWTAVTKDGKISAQWEHTILVTDVGFEVLTLREEERGAFL